MPRPRNRYANRLVRIDFDKFILYNSNPRDAFESLSYFLFCRRFGVTYGIFRYKNQAGIETNPLKAGRDLIGFQSKYFESKIDKSQLIDSLKIAREKHPKINKLIFYINKEFTEGRRSTTNIPQSQKAVEGCAKKLGIKIEWVVPSNFEILLNEPTNLDLAQLYFNTPNQFGFIKGGANHRIQTFLQSDEYLNLPLAKGDKIVKKPITSILRSKQKCFLIIGHPGSGKSIFIHFLFREIGGLNKKTERQMAKLLVRNQAVPMLINLKDCIAESLENLIRARQVESNVRGQSMGFIYLLDGLDELSEDRADQVLSSLRELEQKSGTKKIIISCRSGNMNRIKVPVYLPDIIEFHFCDLDLADINKFFAAKHDKKKIKLLDRLHKINQKVLKEIKDILLIGLLWDTIEKLGPISTVADLIEQKINLLLGNPDHKKNVDSLNLLDTKSNEIIALNQEISFRFQKKLSYRFHRKELQEIILNIFPRLDYKSVNELLNYLSNLFFDGNYIDDDSSPSFIYQHRSYQEFFFTQRLKIEYEGNPVILRNLDILSNREYFEGYFMPYLRKEYERKENITGLLDLNLIDVYLGNHSGFGVDDAYYLNSSEFIPALANQNHYLIDELLESEYFQMNKILFIDTRILKEKFKQWQKEKDDFRLNDYLSSIWSSGISALLKHIVIFWKENNKEVARKLLGNLNEAASIYKENKYLEQVNKERKPDNPYWIQWEDYIFILICIQGNKVADIFRRIIRQNYQNIEDGSNAYFRKNEGKDKLVKSFFNVVMRYRPSSLILDIDQMDDYEFTAFLDVLRSYKLLDMFINDKKLQAKIRSALTARNIVFSEEKFFIAFYKAFLGIPFIEDENNLLRELLKNLKNERKIDWSLHEVPIKYSFISFALGENSIESLKPNSQDHVSYYDELALYSALFDVYVKILEGKKTIGQALRGYISYVDHNYQSGRLYLEVDISFLWAEIFSISNNLPTDDLIILKTQLLREGTNIIPYSFHYHLVAINKKLFDKLVNESDIINYEDALKSANDYQSLVNDCFSLAIFYSRLNEEKSRFYFIKGLKNGVLRHGWRKDTLVSYQLVEGLEILWRNNWETREKLIKHAHDVFNLTLRVSEFTDGKHTWQGPYNVIDLVSKYDVKLAELLKKKLIDKKGYSNYNNIAVTSVLLGRVRLGDALEDLEKEMSEFRKDYDYEGKPNSDIYEQKITVYVAIAESDLYEDQERADALAKAYDLVEEMKKENVSYYLNDSHFRELKIRYRALCQKYRKNPNVEIEEKNDLPLNNNFSEPDFIKDLQKNNTKSKINNLYNKIGNYESGIVLTRKDSWKALLEQTYKISRSIRPFIKLLESFSFPNTDFYTNNSPYFHYGLAFALSNINMKPEAVRHLYKNTGHGGFINMMKVYEVIGDKQMSNKLFNRYLQLCHFLSD
ncbi:MAG: hypothetical protein ABSF88_11840 [Candidatus Aminicenantales bacterium]